MVESRNKYAMKPTVAAAGFRSRHSGFLRAFGPMPAVMLAIGIMVGPGVQVVANNSSAPADRGLDHLLHRGYLPADFDQEVFDSLWTTWEEPLRSQAEGSGLAERRRMAMDRYGLLPHPQDPSRSLQYVVDDAGRWTMSCLACHQGQVAGRMIPGLPNSNYALETLTEEVRAIKVQQRKAFGHMDLGSLLLPLGTTNGTTNAVIFGVALMRHRDADLNIIQRPPRFDLVHNDMDAPPWWHYRKRKSLYVDGFAAQGHRPLMQFLLVKENGPERFREWEDEFREIEAWIASLEPPAWAGPVDHTLAAVGEAVFGAHCAECHGSYGGDTSHPERLVPIEEVGTDRVRLDSLSAADRRALNDSWFGHFGADAEAAGLRDREQPLGYVAPPLDGIWASAPYFHNGSVPTLWHVLHPAERPVVWRRSPTGYDSDRVGLDVEEFAEMPGGTRRPAERRQFFDTRRPGKSRLGHDFADVLDEDEKQAVLEYLKTL
jgi:mono/diheme cytochrome c family protein